MTAGVTENGCFDVPIQCELSNGEIVHVSRAWAERSEVLKDHLEDWDGREALPIVVSREQWHPLV